jgi:hypothetical protein
VREIKLAASVLVPRNERDWLRLQDRLRNIWLNASRRPLKGIVKVSYLWEMPQPPKTVQDEANIAVGLIGILEFLVDVEARMYVGEARCERAEKSMLRVTVEEA